MVIEAGKLAGNAILNYSQATIKSKTVNLDVTGTDTFVQTNAKGYIEADSNGEYWFTFSIDGTIVADTAITITIAGVVFEYVQSVSCLGLSNESKTAYTNAGAATISVQFESASYSNVRLSETVKLSDQPTDAFVGNDGNFSTFQDCLEASTDASIYVQSASVTQSGLVDIATQSFAGVKTFNAGISLGDNTLAKYKEGIHISNYSGARVVNSVSHWYTIIGDRVNFTFQNSATTNSPTAGSFVMDTALPSEIRPSSNTRLPVVVIDNATAVIGSCFISASTGVVTIYPAGSTAFSASGSAGILDEVTISWRI